MKNRTHTRLSHYGHLTINPFVSKAQRRACYAADDPAWDCDEWEEGTPKRLPEKKDKKDTKSSPTANAIPLSQYDPSGTLALSQSFQAVVNRRFEALNRVVLKISEWEGRVDNAFCPTGKGGGVDPTCSPGDGGGGGGAKTGKEFVKSLTKDEKKSIKLWNDEGKKSLYSKFRALSRDPDTKSLVTKMAFGPDKHDMITDEQRQAFEHFKSALAKAPTHTGDLFRGEKVRESSLEDFLARHKVGSEVSISALTPTSKNTDTARKFSQVTLSPGWVGIKYIYRDATGKDISAAALPRFQGEEEVILPVGARFKVTKIDHDKTPRLHHIEHSITVYLSPDTPTANKGPYEYACVKLDVTDPAFLQRVRAVQRELDPEDIVEAEDTPHITVLFGLHDSPELYGEVERLVRGYGEIELTLGELALFEHPDKDILIVTVEPDQKLSGLNDLLKTLPYTNEYPYHPHLTIAYLTKGTGHKYLGLSGVKGQMVKFDTLTFSDKGGYSNKLTVNMVGNKAYKKSAKYRAYKAKKAGGGGGNCGTGAGGFQPGNTCGKGKGSVVDTLGVKMIEAIPKVTEWVGEEALPGVLSTKTSVITTALSVFVGGDREANIVAAATVANLSDSLVHRLRKGVAWLKKRKGERERREHKKEKSTTHNTEGQLDLTNPETLREISAFLDEYTPDEQDLLCLFIAYIGVDESDLDTVLALADEALTESEDETTNAFCPTGKGGGVDPTCSPNKGGNTAPHSMRLEEDQEERLISVKELVRDSESFKYHYEVAQLIREGAPQSKLTALGWDEKHDIPAVDKYRKMYREGGENKFRQLIELSTHKGKIVVDDGSHRLVAALAEGAEHLRFVVKKDSGITLGEVVRQGQKFENIRIKSKNDKLGVLITRGGIYEPGVGSYDAKGARKRADKLDSLGKKKEVAESLRLAADQLENPPTQNIRTAISSLSGMKYRGRVTSFRKRVEAELSSALMTKDEWASYITKGYSKGVERTYDEVLATRKLPFTVRKKGAVARKEVGKILRKDFIDSTLGLPQSRRELKTLSRDGYSYIEKLVKETTRKMAETFEHGLETGLPASKIQANLTAVLNRARNHMGLIAQTEIVRAQAEGQLRALEQVGVTEAAVKVEWQTSAGSCDECKDMDGRLYRVKDAHGMIPRHPRCRCAFAPVVPARNSTPSETPPSPNIDPLEDLYPLSEIVVTDNRSFFADCQRDKGGRCLPREGGQQSDDPEFRRAQKIARDKAKRVVEPTAEEVRENREGIAKMGANLYRRNLVGNSADRRRRREALLKEFGDGTTCPCVFCTTPDSLTLTVDLTWKRLGDLQVGEHLISFDEEIPKKHTGRGYRQSTVEHLEFADEQVYEVCLSSGRSLFTTAEHRWLAHLQAGPYTWLQTYKPPRQTRAKGRGGRPSTISLEEWNRTINLYETAIALGRDPIQVVSEMLDITPAAARGRIYKARTYGKMEAVIASGTLKPRISEVPVMFNPWKTLENFDAGYLSGILDGEGWYRGNDGMKKTGIEIGIAQNSGPVLDRILALLKDIGGPLGVQCTTYGRAQDACVRVHVGGSMSAKLALLGSVRPIRLMRKVHADSLGQILSTGSDTVMSIRPVGIKEIVKVTTSTGTLFIDGYPMHNCGIRVGEGSMEQDKIKTTAEGGRYRLNNLVPSCSSCNKVRGDTPWSKIKWPR